MSKHPVTSRPFKLGQIVATPGALDALARSGESAGEFLNRHARCDWGDVDAEDWALNDQAVAHEDGPDRQGRVLSAYKTTVGDKLWVITEADRSSSTILKPEEY